MRRIPRSPALTVAAVLTAAQLPQPNGGPFDPGTLPARWRSGGPNCIETPDWQVHEYNANFFILRESGCTHYEKPFLYLIFGRDRALLEDTGAGAADTAAIVDNVMRKWLKRNNRPSIPLMVIHSHGHDDHMAGDPQFRGRAGIELIEATVAASQKAFGIGDWPGGIGHIDLGARELNVIPIPGHQEAAIALYDRQTGILLTGDHLYPGRLYVSDWRAFAASTARLVEFTQSRPVTHVLGTHIEQMNLPFRDYPVGTAYQPDEHALELTRAHLLELNEALREHGDKPERLAYRDFTIWPKTPNPKK